MEIKGNKPNQPPAVLLQKIIKLFIKKNLEKYEFLMMNYDDLGYFPAEFWYNEKVTLKVMPNKKEKEICLAINIIYYWGHIVTFPIIGLINSPGWWNYPGWGFGIR